MSTTNGSGYQNVDDILKSIRSASGDQNLGPRFIAVNGRGAQPQPASGAGPGSALVKRDQFVAESADFDLPAIFKPGHQAPAEKPNIFGRLSDAWKPSPQEPERPRTVIRFEPASAQRMIEPPRAAVSSSHPAAPNEANASPNVAGLNENENVKRELPTFFDTRLNRMGQTPRSMPSSNAVARAEGRGAGEGAPMPPALADVSRNTHQSFGMEDAAAQLLRPILQQWLSENMPKIVEKALRSETDAHSADGDFARAAPRKPSD